MHKDNPVNPLSFYEQSMVTRLVERPSSEAESSHVRKLYCRIDAGLFEALKERARVENRSINGQVAQMLKEGL